MPVARRRPQASTEGMAVLTWHACAFGRLPIRSDGFAPTQNTGDMREKGEFTVSEYLATPSDSSWRRSSGSSRRASRGRYGAVPTSVVGLGHSAPYAPMSHFTTRARERSRRCDMHGYAHMTELAGCSTIKQTPRAVATSSTKARRSTRAFWPCTYRESRLPITSRCRPDEWRDMNTQLLHGGAAQSTPPGLNRRTECSSRTKPTGHKMFCSGSYR